MAQYPTANPSFTTKNTGDTIQPSHINGIQDEVVAIGTDLRGGLQHALTVNGAVTVSTGGLTVSTGTTSLGQNLTVAGSATLSSLVTAPAQPRCLVFSTVAQQLAAGSFTTITFDSEQFDVGGLHSTGTNPSRITVPAGSSGLYLVGASMLLSTGGAGDQAFLRVVKNSTTEVCNGMSVARGSSAGTSLRLTSPLVLDGGDYIEAEIFATTSTGSIQVASVRRAASDFWAMKIW